MWTIFAGVFLVLHGLVHLLYAGQGRSLFEMAPGMTWPAGSWAFSKYLSASTTGWLAAGILLAAAVGYIAGGAGLAFRQDWWRPAAIGAALLSSLAYLLFWDGRFNELPEQGGIGILINLAVLAAVLHFGR